MDNFTALSIDNKAVAYALLNGRVIYSSLPNYSTTTLTLESTTLSAVGIDDSLSGTYTLPDGVSYSYQGYATPAVEFVGIGGGSSKPFAISPHVWCRAKHYNTQLTAFTDPAGAIKTVVEQVPLTEWAKDNNLQVPSEDISDIEMITTEEAYGTTDQLPYLMDYSQFKGMF